MINPQTVQQAKALFMELLIEEIELELFLDFFWGIL